MASPLTVKESLRRLRLMRGSFVWNKEHAEEYALAMLYWWDDLATRAIDEVYNIPDEKGECWRPAVGELNAIAARIASPLPNVGDLWQEFLYRQGTWTGSREPSWSHPVLFNIVRRLGGWKIVSESRPHLSETYTPQWWHTRFTEAFAVCEREWYRQVIKQLQRPDSERDRRYIEEYGSFRLPEVDEDPVYPILPRPDFEPAPCPPAVKQQVLAACGQLRIAAGAVSEVFE